MSIKSAVCAVAICLASGAALAQPASLPAGPVAGLGPIMPPQEIGKILRARGFAPQATPVRNGEAYQVRAIDRYGRQVRVAIDARYGDILMVRPIAMVPPAAYGPRPYGSPPGYHDDMPTGAIGAYPPPGRAAALAPAKPPIPRPKPAVKPTAAAATPSASQEAAPASAASPASTPAEPAAATPAASPAATSPPAATPAMPPVAPLD